MPSPALESEALEKNEVHINSLLTSLSSSFFEIIKERRQMVEEISQLRVELTLKKSCLQGDSVGDLNSKPFVPRTDEYALTSSSGAKKVNLDYELVSGDFEIETVPTESAAKRIVSTPAVIPGRGRLDGVTPRELFDTPAGFVRSIGVKYDDDDNDRFSTGMFGSLPATLPTNVILDHSDDFAASSQSPPTVTRMPSDASTDSLHFRGPRNANHHSSVPRMCSMAMVSTRSIDTEAGVTTIFPRWFNPYLQDTYLGDRRGSIDIAAMLKMADAHGTDDETVSTCILKPLCRERLSWDFVWSICLVWEIWMTPLDIVFFESGSMPEALQYIGHLVLAYFAADIFLNFFTGYMDGDKEIMNRRLIFINYLKSWFFFDIIATIPWELFGGTETASTSRAARVSKVLKIMKLARLLRIVKLSHHIQNVKRVQKQRAIDYVMNTKKKMHPGILEKLSEQVQILMKPLKPILTPLQMSIILVLLAHAHAAVWGALRDDWQSTGNVTEVFRRYYESFWWAFSMLTFGSPKGYHSPGMWTLEIVILLERFIFYSYIFQILLFHALVLREDDAKNSLRNANAMAYLRQHDVSVKTQVQVLLNLDETGSRRKLHKHFTDLMGDDLPRELRRRVSEELWSKRLTGLALINAIGEWREEFISELAVRVREETFASKILIFKEGDSAVAAYLVLAGALLVQSTFQIEPIPPFTKGMWVGERALVNPCLRRSATCITRSVTTLMVVPAREFQALLEKQGMLQRFQQFCSEELWRGLCGRCGLMGDHFGNECPALTFKKKRSMSIVGVLADTGGFHMSRDLRMYLEHHNLKRIKPALIKKNIENLDQLEEGGRTLLLDEMPLSNEELRLLGREAITEFKTRISQLTLSALSAKLSGNHHFIFLSHFKTEAGTEASLMRAELEQLIQDDSGHPAQGLGSAIFLDTEDLSDLADLMKAVVKSHNLVLMLTKGVLTRPWCILEIVVSMRDHVNIVPVKISKPDAEFQFPDETFYAQMQDGQILGKEGTKLVESHGFSMSYVVRSLRRVFKRIALPYSPHRAGAIRRAELQALLRQCSCRVISDEKVATGFPDDIDKGIETMRLAFGHVTADESDTRSTSGS